jgi:hypothetical protein
MGAPLDVAVTMCGCGSTEPVRFSLNGTAYDVPVTNQWQTWHFTVERTPTMYEHSLYLEWRSQATPRPLVQQVTVTAMQPHAALSGALWAGLAVALVLLLGRQQPRREQLQWVSIITVSALMGRLLYQPQLLPWDALAALGGGAAAALTWLCPDRRQRLMLWALCLWLLAVPHVLGTWVLDDAFISFRYADNLVSGHGLTFNPGGERVEGYTNFLWTIIIAGALALGMEPVLTAQVLCSALALAALLLIYRLGRAWWPDGPWALLPPALLAFNPSFLLYTARGSGMETALVTVLALAALWLIWQARTLRGGLLAGVLCALVVMTRPDGALVPLAGGLVLLAQTFSRDRRGWALPALAGLVAGFALLYGPYFLWRWSYYGYLLPNTFYAKTGATTAQVQRGAAYTLAFIQSLGLRSLVVLLGLSVVGLLRVLLKQQTNSGPAPLLWLFVLLTAAYVTLIGGDHFPLGRFFVPALPPLMLLITHGAAQAWELRVWFGARAGIMGRGRLVPPALAGLALLLFFYVNTSPLPRLDSRDPGGRIWGENFVALKNRELGWWFRRNTPPDTVVATGIAGAMPYYGQRQVIDTLGLNDTHIAHLPVATMGQGVAGAEKTDVGYVLDRQPDYIPYSTSGAFQDVERFQQQYQLVTVRGPEGGEILLYRRIE